MNDRGNYSNLYFKHPKSSYQLQELGFKYLGSNEDGQYYRYRFPVEFWKKNDGLSVPTLFCTLTHNTETGKIIVDVNTQLDLPYPDFYHHEFGNPQPLLGRIHKRISYKLKDLEIVDKTVHKKRGKYDEERSKTKRRTNKRASSSGERLLQERNNFRDSQSRR